MVVEQRQDVTLNKVDRLLGGLSLVSVVGRRVRLVVKIAWPRRERRDDACENGDLRLEGVNRGEIGPELARNLRKVWRDGDVEQEQQQPPSHFVESRLVGDRSQRQV